MTAFSNILFALFIVLFIAGVGIWMVFTAVQWMDPSEGKPTLVEVLKKQHIWFLDLAGRIR